MSQAGSLGLEPAARESISRAVAVLGHGRPLPVVVASDAYALLLENWIAHVRALGIDRFLIVAMDDAIAARFSRRGLVVAQSSFDGSAADFWLRRLLVWQYLTESGVHIVQTDVDAIWLRDPVAAFFADQRHDLLCSQGTLHPGDIAARWGFVLCTGLMSVRPAPASVRFFAAMAGRAAAILQSDDQLVMNHMLAEAGVIWNRHGMTPDILDLQGDTFHSYQSVIEATDSSTGLTIGMLPHSLFPRLPTASTGAYVKHVLRPEDDDRRVDELRAVGCWRLA